jgi:tetratricopeptide (TPR) repeat protein
VWVGVVVLVLYLVLAGGGGTGGIYVPAFRIASLAMLVAVIGAWTVVAWRRPELRPATTMWPAIIAVIAAFLISTIASWSLRLSVEFLGYSVLLLALYLLLVQMLKDSALGPRILSLAALLSGFLGVLYILVVVGHWIRWWDAVGTLTTPPLRPGFEGLSYGNPSAVAAITILFLAPAVAWLAGKGRIGAVAIAGLVVLVSVTVVLTGSRGAWLAIGLALAVISVLVLLQPRTREALWARIRRVPRIGLLAGVIGVPVAIVAGPAIIRRLAGGGDALRVTLNLTALRMFGEDPITGSGPGTWVVRRAAFTEPEEVDYYIPHAHNVFTQGLAEFGFVGVVAALIVAAFVARLLVHALRDDSADRRRMAWAAIFGLAYFGGHQVVDLYMNLPAIMFAAVIPVAYLDATALGTREPAFGSPDRRRSVVRALEGRAGLAMITIACAMSIAWLAQIDVAAATSLQASAAAIDDDPASAASLSLGALGGDPDLPAYWFQTGLATAIQDPERAYALMRRSAETDDFPHAWLNVAAMELDRGDPAAAKEALERAIRLGWQQPAVSFPAGTMYAQMDESGPAVEAFAQALVLAPDLGDDPFWESDPKVLAAHDPAVDRAITLGGPSVAPFIALFGGRPDDARSLAEALGDDERQIATLAIDAWTGDDAAQAGLVALAEADPLDTRAVVWSALLAARDGDETARNRFRTWAGIVGGSLGTAIGQDTVVTDKPWNRRQVAGPNANFHGVYTYRRLYPWDLLVPGLPKLTLE